jgi:positive regulator of sigma E activity
MMNTICGTITDIHNSEVQVTISRKAACHGCEASNVCHSLSKSEMDFRLPKPHMPVNIGDQVTIAMSSTSFLKACTYAFLIPLGAIIFALLLAEFLDLGTAVQALCAFCAFLISLIFVRKLGKRIDNPRIIEVNREE